MKVVVWADDKNTPSNIIKILRELLRRSGVDYDFSTNNCDIRYEDSVVSRLSRDGKSGSVALGGLTGVMTFLSMPEFLGREKGERLLEEVLTDLQLENPYGWYVKSF